VLSVSTIGVDTEDEANELSRKMTLAYMRAMGWLEEREPPEQSK
jgi:hypothetical protein